jgi:hypothetical protein
MRKERTATIIVTLDLLGIEEKKHFMGTEEEVYAEAHDFMNEVVMRFIDENAIEEPDEQYLVADCATHTIVWDEWDVAPIAMFVVYENDYVKDPVLGIYATLADAEEAIFTECEWYVYETMMTEDPLDVYGTPSWIWKIDYKWLMEDALRTFNIQEVPVYM